MLREPRLILLVALLLMAGCAGQGTRDIDPPGDSQADWEAHSQRLQQLEQWQANGKLAMRTTDRAESATLVWQQRGDNTVLQLSGPVGLSATTITSDGRQMEIRQGNEVSVLDISTPHAIADSTGWDLPLSALPFWLKGMPSPDTQAQELDLDPATRLLRTLKQDDWEVHYEKYEPLDDLQLPTRLRIRKGETSARIIIRKWQTLPS